jgi:hypothetical protein
VISSPIFTVISHSSSFKSWVFVRYLGAKLFRHEVRGQIGSDEDLLRLLIVQIWRLW